MKTRIAVSTLIAVFAGILSYAIPYNEDPPKIQELIQYSDAIVILRIDTVTGGGTPDSYTTHECFIYQTLKGTIPEGERITVQLADTEHGFVTPYAWGSTHLVFLTKKISEREPTEYRSLMTNGAQVLVSPLGQEKEPEGATLEEKVRNAIEGAIAYQTEVYEKKMKFLNAMLNR